MHEKIKCSGHLKNFLNSISTMVHFFMWVQYIFSIKRSSFLLVCISEQDIILHQGQVLHHFKFIQKRHLNNSIQFLQKKYWGFNCTCIGPTINFHPDIDPKIEVDPIINGEEKYGGLYFHGSFCLGHSWRFDCQPICTMLHLLLEKCNYPKISKSFKFLYLFLNIDFLILSNINDPSKIIDIIETKFLKYRYVSVIGSYTVKSWLKVHLFDGKPLGTMILDFHFQVFWFWCLKFCSYVLFLRQNEWKEPKMTVVIILRKAFLKNNSIEVIKCLKLLGFKCKNDF